MSVFCQVSSTPESVYEEIYQEKFTEEYYVNLFLDRLLEIAKRYDRLATTMTIDTYIRVLIRGLIYKETKRSISRIESVPYPTILYTIEKVCRHRQKFLRWGQGESFDNWPVESCYCHAILEKEIIQAFKNRFGEEFNYAEISKDHRIQEAIKSSI